jgi:hypothetical protein
MQRPPVKRGTPCPSATLKPVYLQICTVLLPRRLKSQSSLFAFPMRIYSSKFLLQVTVRSGGPEKRVSVCRQCHKTCFSNSSLMQQQVTADNNSGLGKLLWHALQTTCISQEPYAFRWHLQWSTCINISKTNINIVSYGSLPTSEGKHCQFFAWLILLPWWWRWYVSFFFFFSFLGWGETKSTWYVGH